MKVGGSIACSNYKMVEFMIRYVGSRATHRIETLDFRRDNFGLFRKLHGRIPWVRDEGMGV